MGKTIHIEGRNLVLKVPQFLENEKKNRRFCIPVDQEYWEKDDLVDDVLQQLVIDLGGEESSDEIESEEEDSLDHDIVPIIYSEDEF
ncbi:unnamed protein product [Parnassius apollo]|uniref:(apollo) hypothetical protein n=1 Tax=Parnassius apollo TaxID=110799 RepID=A0A8S3W4B5_PARAO|nr:unnamed protein product [Parnassius apollo]